MLYKGFKRDLLLFIGNLSDIGAELSFDTAYKRLYWPDYQPRYASQEISRMVRVGELTKEIRNGQPVLKVTAKGWGLLDETLPLWKMAKKKWDGRWRAVIFDIEEKDRQRRDRLRTKLKSLGLGRWQRSVYITPHNILKEVNEFLQEKQLTPQCVCLEAKQLGKGGDQQLASKVFKLERLNNRYRKIAAYSKKLTDPDSRYGNDFTTKTAEFGKIRDSYRKILLEDPYLPKELLPKDWYANQAKLEFGKLLKTFHPSRRSAGALAALTLPMVGLKTNKSAP